MSADLASSHAGHNESIWQKKKKLRFYELIALSTLVLRVVGMCLSLKSYTFNYPHNPIPPFVSFLSVSCFLHIIGLDLAVFISSINHHSLICSTVIFWINFLFVIVARLISCMCHITCIFHAYLNYIEMLVSWQRLSGQLFWALISWHGAPRTVWSPEQGFGTTPLRVVLGTAFGKACYK